MRVLLVAALTALAHAQLRPRRVGLNAMGEQEPQAAAADAAPTGGLEDLQNLASALGGEGGAGGLDMGSLLANNPMLKNLAASNPEMADLLNNPEAMKAQMGQMMEMFQSPEGQAMAKNMMSEMQSMLTDPEKMKENLAQLSTNPALKGFADAVPGLRDLLDDPEKLGEQAEKAAELFSAMQDPEKAKELLGSLGADGEGLGALEKLQEMFAGGEGEGMAALMEKFQEAMGGAAGEDSADLSDMQQKIARITELMQENGGEGMLSELLGGEGEGEGEGDALKARVREQLASMMHERGGGGAAALDDEF